MNNSVNEQLLEDSCQIALISLLQSISQFAEQTQVDTQIMSLLEKKINKSLQRESLKSIFTIANQLATGLATLKINNDFNQQATLFENIHFDDKPSKPKQEYVYQLEVLSPNSIFPIKAQTTKPNYAKLWQDFAAGLNEIPTSHEKFLSLWLDHFDSCFQTYAHHIPSPFSTEVSLYDQAKTATAIATALWRYHDTFELFNEEDIADKQLSKLLLIQADFFGIQNFIFAQGGDSTKKAAKLLRGRSFYVSLITECAALKVLETLSLPSTSQIINAAGKFLIVAPNTEDTIQKLQDLQQQFNQWFLDNSYGQSGLGLAWTAASCDDFVSSHFQTLMEKLFKKLERSKYQHFDLCAEKEKLINLSSNQDEQEYVVFKDYLDTFNNRLGVCQLNDKAPATKKEGISELAHDQINIGSWLIRKQRLLISKNKINGLNTLNIPLFDYHVAFIESEELQGKFGAEVSNKNLRRLFDFSPASSFDFALWNGYARRNISGYVPFFSEDDEWHNEKYDKFLDDEDLEEVRTYAPKLLNHLALEDVNRLEDGHWYGIKALAVLKGDIDNLGSIFQTGLKQPTFAKMAALSRQVNNFFAVYLPYLCSSKYKNTYIVFAGGDDFFLLGSWHQLIKLANELRTKFQEYVADNPDIHFSCGLTVMKPNIPIYQLAEISEQALEQAKHHQGKNAVTCFKQTVSWDDFAKLTQQSYERLEDLREEYELSTGYIYGLMRLCDMAADNEKPENSLWRSQLYYRTYRNMANNRNLDKEAKKRACEKLANDIGKQGIEDFKKDYQITLHAHLYKHRKQS